jgi:tetratricopeptide (TPR) repeat protein
MAHICNLYESHHLQVYKAIVDVTFALYIPNSDALKDDEPVEDVLAKMEKIFTTYSKDTNYQHLQLVFNNLAFEYYHKLNLPKKEARYFDEVDKKLTSFLLFNHCCFTTKFLISKIERYVELGIEGELYEQNQKLLPNYEPDKNDIPNYINFSKYMATSAFYAKKYQEAVQILNNLINDISFKNYPHSEIEVKLLLALNYSMINKYDPATSLLRSVTRKIREIDDEMGYENALIFYKILSLQMSSSARQVDQKIGQLFSKFELLNQKSNRMLEYIKVDEAFIKALSQVVKR